MINLNIFSLFFYVIQVKTGMAELLTLSWIPLWEN